MMDTLPAQSLGSRKLAVNLPLLHKYTLTQTIAKSILSSNYNHYHVLLILQHTHTQSNSPRPRPITPTSPLCNVRCSRSTSEQNGPITTSTRYETTISPNRPGLEHTATKKKTSKRQTSETYHTHTHQGGRNAKGSLRDRAPEPDRPCNHRSKGIASGGPDGSRRCITRLRRLLLSYFIFSCTVPPAGAGYIINVEFFARSHPVAGTNGAATSVKKWIEN